MTGRHGRVVLLALGAAGAVAGHALAYLTSVADPGLRQTLLAETGHGYWGAAVAVAVLGGLAAAVVRLTGHLRSEGTPVVDDRFALRLAAAQILVFVIVEVGERLLAGAPLGHVFHEHLLGVGIVVQVLVALALVLLLRLLARGIDLVRHALRRPRPVPGEPAPRPVRRLRVAGQVLVAAGGARAPPVRS